MEDETYFISQNISLLLIFSISIVFVFIGILYSRKKQNLSNYLTAGRNVETLSLTSSLIASALGAWILFGPASAATWGGIGSVIGYSLGTAFPMIALIFLGTKIRRLFPKGTTLTEFIYYKFGKKLFKVILILTIFYMFIFLCAEVTAISMLINYISGTKLWLTATLIIFTTLIYTLHGGLRASIFTDNLQFFIIVIFLLFCFYYLFFENSEINSYKLIKDNAAHLLSKNYIPNYTAGLTFFIAVAATNLFHQGNWQRVFAAKTDKILKKSLLYSFIFIIPIIFFMGISGILAISIDRDINPDLALFSILLKKNTEFISIVIIFLAISLVVSTIDTLVNAISSLIIVDGKKILNHFDKKDFFKLSKFFIIIISIASILIASKGYSILYLFLFADLLCCSAVLTTFYCFYKKNFREKDAMISIFVGLFVGLLLFPSPDFSQSIFVGFLVPTHFFPKLISDYLLFWSFLFATITPLLRWKFN